MSITKLVKRIQTFNQGREPQRLQLKYEKMRQDAFTFLRATCHLFYEDLADAGRLNDAPLAWICGDLHLENFGVFKSGNRFTYFDINDFDEAVLAPCTWDLARFLTSVWLAAGPLAIPPSEVMTLGDRFLQSYRDALRQGKAQWVERQPPVEVVQTLFDQLAQRNRRAFLQKRTCFNEQTNQQQLIIDHKRTLPLRKGQREAIAAFMPQLAEQYLTEQQAKPELFQQLDGRQVVNPEFFNVLDAARRIAGGGSLGLERFVILVEGKGSPHRNYLLDLKQAQPASLEPYLKKKWKQPGWRHAAQRIVSIQTQVQAFTPALLTATMLKDQAYVLKELQPSQGPTDRVVLEQLGQSAQLEKLMTLMGRVVAWAELRSSGYQRAATADELIDFAESKRWQKSLMEYAQTYSERVKQDWGQFSEAFDQGIFKRSEG